MNSIQLGFERVRFYTQNLQPAYAFIIVICIALLALQQLGLNN